MFNNGNFQANNYNENDIHRLSNVIEGEDPIAQAMGMQQPQLPHPILLPNTQQPLPQRQPQQIPQIDANGKTISIAIAPDGTITITIN